MRLTTLFAILAAIHVASLVWLVSTQQPTFWHQMLFAYLAGGFLSFQTAFLCALAWEKT